MIFRSVFTIQRLLWLLYSQSLLLLHQRLSVQEEQGVPLRESATGCIQNQLWVPCPSLHRQKSLGPT